MTPAEFDIESAARDLHAAGIAATPKWVRDCVARVVTHQHIAWPDDADAWLDSAVNRAVTFVDTRLGDLLGTDIDQQRTTPLSIFRDAVRFPVEVLHQLGAEPVHRGDMSRWAFPNDPYGITPGNLSDIGATVFDAGVMWGATKAGLHLSRRRAEGKR